MRDTRQQPLVTAISRLALPATLSFLLQNFYHVNDAYFLGQTGPDATNAMALFMMLSIANFGFILTLARGTQSLVGRRLGAGNRLGTQLALTQGLRLSGMVLVPLGVLEWIALPWIFEAMGGTGATVTEGVAYMRTLLLFLPFLFAAPILDFSMQGMGDTKTPFLLQIVAVSVNFLLNFLLVLPHELAVDGGGLRFDDVSTGLTFGLSAGVVDIGGLGVVGAALATGCSRMLSSGCGFLILWRRDGLEQLVRPAAYRFDRKVYGEILRVGLPTGSSTFLYAAVASVVISIIGRFGQDAYGAYAIGFRGVESLSFMIVLGFGVATGTVAAHATGAGDLARARRAASVGTALCSVVMLVTTTLFLTIPGELVGFFTDDAAIAATAATYISIMALCQVPQALEMVYGDAMAGAGSSVLAACVSIPGNVLRIPLALWFTGGLEMGLSGVWWAIVASAVLKGLGMVVLFFSGAWERAVHGSRGILEAR